METKRLVILGGVYFGGNANNGTNAGLFYANSNNAPSNTNANIGSRIYFNEKKGGDLTSWWKKTELSKVLVGMPFV